MEVHTSPYRESTSHCTFGIANSFTTFLFSTNTLNIIIGGSSNIIVVKCTIKAFGNS